MKTKKELKAEYRQRKPLGGVLQIRNTVSGRVFLDAGLDLPALWNRHRFQLDLGNHPNRELQADWKTLGVQAFAYEVVVEWKPRENEDPRDSRGEVATLLELSLEELRPFGAAGYHEEPCSRDF